MKQRISKDLIQRRLWELLAGGMDVRQAVLRIGIMVLEFYNIKVSREEENVVSWKVSNGKANADKSI